MEKTLCEKENCTGCRACENICPVSAISIKEYVDGNMSVINDEICINCGRCEKVCPNFTEPEFRRSLKYMQGWIKDEKKRKKGSSGGAARALSECFIKTMDGVVVSCSFTNGEFIYSIASTVEQLDKFWGSKYVKSDMRNIYTDIKMLLERNTKVLFTGLPCHCAALINYINMFHHINEDALYIVDLICHGTPSIVFLDSFLKEKDIERKKAIEITFRKKMQFSISVDNVLKGDRCIDKYTLAYMEGYLFTQNCFSCKYATEQRVSDITLGDAKGTELTEEFAKGLSLIICNSEKGQGLIDAASMVLNDIEVKSIMKENPQLKHPSIKPGNWNSFLKDFNSGIKFTKLVAKYCPKRCLKEDIKKCLILLHLIKPDSRWIS